MTGTPQVEPSDCARKCSPYHETTTVFEGGGQSRGIHSNSGNSEARYLIRITFKHSVIELGGISIIYHIVIHAHLLSQDSSTFI